MQTTERASNLAGIALGLLASCGSEPAPAPEETGAPLSVAAEPQGYEFLGSTSVELIASEPAQIFYTTDGEEPTSEHARIYRGPIELKESTYLTFIAFGDGEIWSPPRRELYVYAPTIAPQPQRVARALELTPDHLFFGAQLGEDSILEHKVTIRSIGPASVNITSLALGINAKGSSFWEPGIFSIDGGGGARILRSGESLTLTVRYQPTETFRSAAVIIESDEERNGGHQEVELWGRRISW